MGLPPIIKALLDPGAYPDHPSRIELIQTHISYILIAGSFVYKIKKPVDFGFLDFTSLEKRRFFCEEEVRLNSRLAGDVYIGVEKIAATDTGFRINGQGPAVEYAVKMKRLSDDSMLNFMLAKGKADEGLIRRVAKKIADFHLIADTDERISSFGFPEKIGGNTQENFTQSQGFIDRTISEKTFKGIKNFTEDFLEEKRDFFSGRVKGGFIRDCHGDLHSEHISVFDGINIFDCIEFNERFRFSDVVADMAFLSMDIDSKNRSGLSKAFDEKYFSSTGDTEGRRLLGFYKCYRAFVRGKVESFKSTEEEVSAIERARAAFKASLMFRLARQYYSGGYRPMLLAISGLAGTGKSFLAKELSSHSYMPVLSSDEIRKELAKISPDERRFEAFEKGIYAPEFTGRVYAELFSRAKKLLNEGRSVILDATFMREKHRREAQDIASRISADFRLIECAPDEGQIREWLAKRLGEKGAATDGRLEIYLEQKKRVERGGVAPHAAIDTGKGIAASLKALSLKIFD